MVPDNWDFLNAEEREQWYQNQIAGLRAYIRDLEVTIRGYEWGMSNANAEAQAIREGE